MKVGIIGGSGFYSIGEEIEKKEISTPFGKVNVRILQIDDTDHEIIFLPRHGDSHSIPPHAINYRANIYALFSEGIDHILTTNAVGSCKNHLMPGNYLLPHDFLDFTDGRPKTFFDGQFSVKTRKKGELKEVVHTDISEPFSPFLRKKILETAQKMGVYVHNGGTIAVFNGPRFETPAEIKMISNFADVVGMTTVPEVVLSKEIGVEYQTMAVITNKAAGFQSEVTHNEVIELFNEKIEQVAELLITTAKNIILEK
ncbi:MAG: MTAP family purine nucleoside phosphorylase [Promethearchaeota archaeon]